MSDNEEPPKGFEKVVGVVWESVDEKNTRSKPVNKHEVRDRR